MPGDREQLQGLHSTFEYGLLSVVVPFTFSPLSGESKFVYACMQTADTVIVQNVVKNCHRSKLPVTEVAVPRDVCV